MIEIECDKCGKLIKRKGIMIKTDKVVDGIPIGEFYHKECYRLEHEKQ